MNMEEIIEQTKRLFEEADYKCVSENLMKLFKRWIVKKTPAYLKFTENGSTDFEYLGFLTGKACIPKEEGLDFAKTLGWYDITRFDDLEMEFMSGYEMVEANPEWREKLIHKYLSREGD